MTQELELIKLPRDGTYKPLHVTVLNNTMTDLDAASRLEMYDYRMTSDGPVFFSHDLYKFVDLLYNVINGYLPEDLHLEQDGFNQGGSTLWMPAFVSPFEAMRYLKEAGNKVSINSLMQRCRTGLINPQ